MAADPPHRIERDDHAAIHRVARPQDVRGHRRRRRQAHSPKLIPPEEVIEAELETKFEAAVRAKITERILREAGLDRQVEDAMEQVELPTGCDLTQDIKDLFELDRAEQWRTQVDATVDECLKKVT